MTKNSESGIDTTVIIISHERPATLRRALDSLAGQRYQNFKTLIIDDSQDSEVFREISRGVADYHHFPPISQAQAWREGFELADTPFIKILLDDDWLEPDFLCDTVNFLKEHDDCNLVITGADVIFEDRILELYRYKPNRFKITSEEFERLAVTPGNGGLPESPSCCLFRKNSALQIRYEEFDGTELEPYARKVYFNDLLCLIDCALSNQHVGFIPFHRVNFGTDQQSITLTCPEEVAKARGLMVERYYESIKGVSARDKAFP